MNRFTSTKKTTTKKNLFALFFATFQITSSHYAVTEMETIQYKAFSSFDRHCAVAFHGIRCDCINSNKSAQQSREDKNEAYAAALRNNKRYVFSLWTKMYISLSSWIRHIMSDRLLMDFLLIRMWTFNDNNAKTHPHTYNQTLNINGVIFDFLAPFCSRVYHSQPIRAEFAIYLECVHRHTALEQW